MIQNSNDKGFGSIDDAKVTLGIQFVLENLSLTDSFVLFFSLAYYIQTLDEIKKEVSRTDCLKLILHLPALRLYLKNIDKLNLDSVAASKSVRFTRQVLSKYSQLVQKKLYRRLSAQLIAKPIKDLTSAIFRSSLGRTKEAYIFLSRLMLRSAPNTEEHLENSAGLSHGQEDDKEFDLI